MKNKLILVSLALVVAGCAVDNNRTDLGIGMAYHSKITQNTNGNYVASVEASALRGRIGGAKALVLQDATAKCQEMNKAMKVIKNETSSHLLVNGVAKLTFKCQ